MKCTIAVRQYDVKINDWLEIRKRFNHQQSGLQANRRDVKLFSRYLHEHRIRKISGEALLGFISWLIEERNNNAGTINRKISSIRSYIRYLRFRQVDGAEGFPIEYLQRAREPYAGPVETLEVDEVQRLLETIDKQSVLGFRGFLLYSLLYRLGLRISEALAIDLKDIDLEKKVLRIHGKGRRERTLPLVSDIPVLIERWIVMRNRLLGAERLDALFISKKGHRLAVRTAEENFQKIVAATGPLSIKKVTPHTLRHAFASHALETDASDNALITLKAVLGHAVMKSTEIYIHPSMKILRRAVNDHPASEILEDLIDQGIIPIRVHQVRSVPAA